MNIDIADAYGSDLMQLVESTDPALRRAKILNLQELMSNQPQVECPVKHMFAPGVYAREILLPKGSVVIGKIHKHAHLNIISKGRASVMTEFGVVDLQAPCSFVSEPGTKRVVAALEDVIWTTIHPTAETDVSKIEDEIIAKSYDQLGMSVASFESQKIEET